MKLTHLTLTAVAIVGIPTAVRSDEPAADSSSMYGSAMIHHGPHFGLGMGTGGPKPIKVESGAIYRPDASPAVVEREAKRKQAWEEINAKLNMPVTIQLADTPLREGFKQVVSQISVPFAIDMASLEEAGVSIDDPASLDLTNVSAATALRRLLAGQNLNTIIDGEVMVLTTRDRSDEFLTTHVYPVSDLVITTDGGDVVPGVESLITAIQDSTYGRWMDTDGTGGRITPHSYGGVVALAIQQTDDVHREIESLLYQLREARSPAAQKSLEDAVGNDVSRVEREILRLRDEVKETAETLRPRIGSLKIQELTPELRAKIEELQKDGRLERLRSEVESVTPTIRQRLEELRRGTLEPPQRTEPEPSVEAER